MESSNFTKDLTSNAISSKIYVSFNYKVYRRNLMEKHGRLEPDKANCTCGKTGVVLKYEGDTEVWKCPKCANEKSKEEKKITNRHGTYNIFS